MNFDPKADKPVDGEKWFSQMQKEFIREQREELIETYGEDAVEQVIELTCLLADLIYIGSDNVPLLKAGIHRTAELVNGMFPQFEKANVTRRYDHRDLAGVMDPIPTGVQDVFVAMVGTVMLNARGGPFETSTLLGEVVDGLDRWMTAEGRRL